MIYLSKISKSISRILRLKRIEPFDQPTVELNRTAPKLPRRCSETAPRNHGKKMEKKSIFWELAGISR